MLYSCWEQRRVLEWASSSLVLRSLYAGEQWAPKWVPVAFALIFSRLSTWFAWFSDPFACRSLNSPSHSHFPLVLNPVLGAASPPHLFPAGSTWAVGLLHIYFSPVCPQYGAGLRRAAWLWQHSPAHWELTPLWNSSKPGWALQRFLCMWESSRGALLDSQYLPAWLKSFAGFCGRETASWFTVLWCLLLFKDKYSPFLLLCRFAVCLQEKYFSLQLFFIKLRKKNNPPKPKHCHLLAAG